jgi:hypothetical protein
MFVGFTNGSIHLTRNLASTIQVIYSPTGQLVISGGACLGPYTSNVVEYNVVIELLHETIMHEIQSLEVHLDTQLVVS